MHFLKIDPTSAAYYNDNAKNQIEIRESLDASIKVALKCYKKGFPVFYDTSRLMIVLTCFRRYDQTRDCTDRSLQNLRYFSLIWSQQEI